MTFTVVRPVLASAFALKGLRGRHLTLIVGLWVLVVLAQMIWSENYQPDGFYYTDMALRWSGVPAVDAQHQVQQWYASRHVALIPDGGFNPALNHDWALVRPRVVYSLLSVPFVSVLGIRGVMVVPALSMLLVALVVASLGARRIGPGAAVTASLLFLAAPDVHVFAMQNLTDPEAMALFAILLLLLPYRERPLGRKRLALLGGTVLCLCFTRQVGPIVVAIVGAGWLWSAVRYRSPRNIWAMPALVASGVAAAVTAFTMWWSPVPMSYEMTSETQYSSLDQALLHYPMTLAKLVGAVGLNALRFDITLVLLFVLAAVGGVARWRSPSTAVLAGAVVGTFAFAAVNGSPTSRYLFPALPFVTYSAAVGLAWLFARAQSGLPARESSSVCALGNTRVLHEKGHDQGLTGDSAAN